MSEGQFSLTVTQREGYQFDVTFDDPSWPAIRTDEPEPLGTGTAPNPSRVLGAAVGNCLAASLMFCLQKSRTPVTGMTARVTGRTARNDQGRIRIESFDVVIEPGLEEGTTGRYERCLELFEDFCVVTQSVRQGIEVNVTVEPSIGSTPAEIGG